MRMSADGMTHLTRLDLAAVGLIAVPGVAVLNGLVLMASIRRRLDRGDDADDAIFKGGPRTDFGLL
jgi:Cu/Ag efflux pump CusA